MAKKGERPDPQLKAVHRILDMLKNTRVLRWKMSSLESRLAQLRVIQQQRGGGLFGMDITPEIAFLEAAIKVKEAG